MVHTATFGSSEAAAVNACVAGGARRTVRLGLQLQLHDVARVLLLFRHLCTRGVARVNNKRPEQ